MYSVASKFKFRLCAIMRFSVGKIRSEMTVMANEQDFVVHGKRICYLSGMNMHFGGDFCLRQKR
jgi:hypothetical protein